MLLKETVFQKSSGTSSNDNVLTNNLHSYRTAQKKTYYGLGTLWNI